MAQQQYKFNIRKYMHYITAPLGLLQERRYGMYTTVKKTTLYSVTLEWMGYHSSPREKVEFVSNIHMWCKIQRFI